MLVLCFEVFLYLLRLLFQLIRSFRSFLGCFEACQS